MQPVTPFERGENYYLDARREWRDRYGEFIHAAAVWRTVAVVSLLIALFSVGICGYLSVRTRFIPYVIELGKDGTPVVTGFAKEASSSDERVIKALLTLFITDLRSVVSDLSAQKASVERLFHFIRASDPSHQLLIEHFQDKKNDPFERVASETVSVQVTSLLPVTKDTWQVEWIETVRSRAGGEKEKVSQKAMVTVEIVSPQTEELIRHNPIGLFVKDVRWAKVL